MVGLIERTDQITTQWFKELGDAIILLGKTREELGGTEYLRIVHHREQGMPPHLSLDDEKRLQRYLLSVIREGLVRSAHDCSDGGLAVALAESCISSPGAPMGASIKLMADGMRRDALLFGESQSRVVLSVKAEHVDRVSATRIGTVGGSRLVIDVEGDKLGPGCRVDADLASLIERWGNSLEQALGNGR
jgi:phosphoribosylformylglycinamidine synthase